MQSEKQDVNLVRSAFNTCLRGQGPAWGFEHVPQVAEPNRTAYSYRQQLVFSTQSQSANRTRGYWTLEMSVTLARSFAWFVSCGFIDHIKGPVIKPKTIRWAVPPFWIHSGTAHFHCVSNNACTEFGIELQIAVGHCLTIKKSRRICLIQVMPLSLPAKPALVNPACHSSFANSGIPDCEK